MADDRALTWRDVAALLQISRATFYKFAAAGAFDAFELTPRIGPRRYSAAALQRYLDRASVPAPRRLRVLA